MFVVKGSMFAVKDSMFVVKDSTRPSQENKLFLFVVRTFSVVTRE